MVTSPSRVENEIIEFKTSGIHGMGGFALRNIKNETPIIEYVGEKITKAESALRCEANNPYIFNLDDAFDLDGDVAWNPAKFINHSCAPNAEAQFFGDQIWIMAIRKIKAGEEISFNYSYDLENYKEHACKCGATKCVGYMVAEEYFPKFQSGANPAIEIETETSVPILG